MKEVKILPWMGYNQLQAVAFGLNHTQAIIMNYITASLSLGGWADEHIASDGKVFYRCHSSKFLSDMPTLDISTRTLTRQVTELVSMGLIERKIINKTQPYFRVAEKWLYWSPNGGETKCPTHYGQNVGQYNNIITQIKKEKEKEGKEIAEKLIRELSSYLEGTKKHENKFELEGITGGALVMTLVKKLKEVEEGKGLKLEEKRELNNEYITEIKDMVVELSKRYDRYELGQNGKPTQKFIGEVITQIESMFDWFARKGKTVKDLKSTTRNWFNKYFTK